MVLFLLLILLAIVLGLVGAVAKGLLFLLIIGIVIFISALIYGGARLRHGGRRPAR